MSPRLLRVLIGATTAAAVVIFFATAVRALVFSPMEENLPPWEAADMVGQAAVAQATSTAIRKSAPVGIAIPKIGVDATVVDVGIGRGGNMAVPVAYADVGWYRYGPTPGSSGSAVLDGHVDNGFGLPAVFKRLGELNPGDDIFITRADGSKLRFVVREVEIYAVADVPLERIFKRDGSAFLNLITCDGVWSKDALGYDKRLVVYAQLAS